MPASRTDADEFRDDPAGNGSAVEERSRRLPIVHTLSPRTTTTDVTSAGSPAAAGLPMFPAPPADRDPGPAFLDNPARLDITRGATSHVAFGRGAVLDKKAGFHAFSAVPGSNAPRMTR
ncbi:hypothetical protein ABZX77_52240 [Streptomyces sp. NPDC004237]|uniref:hypothetical protein n=1 Tax=Streptomyces sp. NPDC004237 TaxID=3154455 RepID=UPI0033B5A608